MKKILVGLTAASVLAAFSFVPASPVSADPEWKGKRHYYKHRHRDRDRDGVTLRFGSSPSYCHYYWRHGVRYRTCEPRSGVNLRFRF